MKPRVLRFELELSERAFQELRNKDRKEGPLELMFEALRFKLYGDTEPPSSRRVHLKLSELTTYTSRTINMKDW